jgi:predicted metal-binding membrane protein
MNGMTMPPQTWYAAVAGFLGMWMAMMVPMMLPALIPMLSRYRRSVRGVEGMHLHGLTTLVAVGYFTVWACLGTVVYGAGIGLRVVEMRWESVTPWLPVAAGVLLLVAGVVQLTPWKARQLAFCRQGLWCACPPAPDAPGAWRQGLKLGVRCGLCCTGLMLALLAIGAMNLFAMAAVAIAISAERLAPVPLRVARAAGLAIVVAGVLTIART